MTDMGGLQRIVENCKRRVLCQVICVDESSLIKFSLSLEVGVKRINGRLDMQDGDWEGKCFRVDTIYTCGSNLYGNL